MKKFSAQTAIKTERVLMFLTAAALIAPIILQALVETFPDVSLISVWGGAVIALIGALVTFFTDLENEA